MDQNKESDNESNNESDKESNNESNKESEDKKMYTMKFFETNKETEQLKDIFSQIDERMKEKVEEFEKEHPELPSKIQYTPLIKEGSGPNPYPNECPKIKFNFFKKSSDEPDSEDDQEL